VVRGLAGFVLAAGLAFAADPANTLSPAESKEGWKLLFDGKTMDGWDARATSAPSDNGDWRVEEGSLVCPGTTAGWLAGRDTYTNYELRLDFRGAEQVNSGVFLRSQKEGQPHVTGYELQIWDYQPGGYSTGSLVGSVKAEKTKIIPNDWNRFDITANGDHFVVVLNGKTLLDAHDGKHASGVIGFQCGKNNKVEFRNVRVKPLP
jgi:hypothetical protein